MNDWELECPVCSHILYGKEVDEDIICDECGSTIHISAACEWIVKSTKYNDETGEWE